jgi:glycosyltransferase involved in cell wall biosynthesis
MTRRVALFSTRFLPYSETFVHDELRNHQRYEAEVFCARWINRERFPAPRVHVGGPFYELTRLSPRFDQQLSRGGYDLIHAHFGTGAVYALPFARRHRLPLLVTFHGHDVTLLGSAERFLPRNWPYAAFGPPVLRGLTLGLCASIELLELVRELGVPPEKLRLHRLGVDLERFRPGARGEQQRPGALPLVAMVGRFVAKKGLSYGIRAFAQALRAGAQARLVIAGEGPLRRELEATIAREGVAGSVTLAGELPHDRVAALLSEAEVLLAPSATTLNGDRESGLLVAKEASAAGAVPIATWHGGLPEIVDDGRTGFLLPERDVDGMARRLAQLLGDPELRRRMRAAARAKMEAEYGIGARVAALEAIYDEVLEGRR